MVIESFVQLFIRKKTYFTGTVILYREFIYSMYIVRMLTSKLHEVK